MIRNFIQRHPIKTQRLLEIFPGASAWFLIAFPFWGSFILPHLVAYFVIAFIVYFFYKAAKTGVQIPLGYIKVRKCCQIDWKEKLEKLDTNYQKVHHAIMIVNYKESFEILRRNIQSLADQDLPLKQITIILAIEEREGQPAIDRAEELKKIFGKKFGNFFYSIHPGNIAGEIKGKSSNENWAARFAKKKLVDEQGMRIEDITITSCDADAVFHPKHFSLLTYTFLKDKDRYQHVYQAPLFFYNNIWEVPFFSRVTNTIFSMGYYALVMFPPDKLINNAVYTTSLKLADEIDYWDPDIIPEDWHFFFKAFFAKSGKVGVLPICVPVFLDAVLSSSIFKTGKMQYMQARRWAWGVTDIPYVIKNFFIHKEIPFWTKFFRMIRLVEHHITWPVNFFVLTLGATIPTILNPAFTRTALGYNLPRVASYILTIALIFLFMIIVIDIVSRPKRPETFKFWQYPGLLLQWLTMPVTSFLFASLPGLDAHTRLMFGHYLEYQVTEKYNKGNEPQTAKK